MKNKLLAVVSAVAIGSFFSHQAQARVIGGDEAPDDKPPTHAAVAATPQALPAQPLEETFLQQEPAVAGPAVLEPEEEMPTASAEALAVSSQLAAMSSQLQAILVRLAGAPEAEEAATAAAPMVDHQNEEVLEAIDAAVQTMAVLPALTPDEKKQTVTLSELVQKVRAEYKRAASRVEKETKRVVGQVETEVGRVLPKVEKETKRVGKQVEKFFKTKW